MTTYDKSEIVELLRTNDRAVALALVAITNRQTPDEQQSQVARHRNGAGFRPCHARIGTCMAQFFGARGFLTTKQVNYWRQLNDRGAMRIQIYAGQLLVIAKENAANSAAMYLAASKGE